METMGHAIEDYEILNRSPLGRGGFATVYKAICRKTGQEVAIKMEAGMAERVRQEVEIHSQMKHASVLELYTYFEDDDHVYLVLELCRNGELHSYLKNSGGRLSEEETRRFLTQIVKGLLFLHSKNVIHRDMTLSNLLLTENNNIKISDFGLATRLAQPDEKHTTMCGTPNYISPEVITRSTHGLEADVWSVGCMLYTFLVGKPPFATRGVKSTLTRVVMSDYYVPDTLSSEAKDLIQALLRKDPKERMKLTGVLNHPFMTHSYHSLSSQGSQSKCTSSLGSSDSGIGNSPTILSSSTPPSNSRFTSSRSRTRPMMAFPLASLPTLTSQDETGLVGGHCAVDGRLMNSPINSRPVVLNKQSPVYGRDTSEERRRREASSSPSSPHRLQSSSECCNNHSGGSDHRHCHRHGHSEGVDELQRSTGCSGHCSHHFGCCVATSTSSCCSHHEKCACRPRSRSRSRERMTADVSPPPPHREKTLSEMTSPLNSSRLRPTRQKTKNAIVSILENGEVCVEFLRRERVCDVCRISTDGKRIVVYQPNGGRGRVVDERRPPELPENGADGIFGYSSLPAKYWKKYVYAARFVKLVKAKTPKITLYNASAKCMLMENGPRADFECGFYAGDKMVRLASEDSVRVVERVTGKSYTLDDVGGQSGLEPAVRQLHDLFQQYHHHCLELESILTKVETQTGHSCFPVIFGRRPSVSSTDDATASTTANKENVLLRDRDLNRNVDVVGSSSSPTSSMGTVLNSLQSIKLSNPAKTSTPAAQFKVLATDRDVVQRKVFVPDVGWATQYASGELHVCYNDGVQVILAEDSSSIHFTDSDGRTNKYGSSELLPAMLKIKLAEMPHVVQCLAKSKRRT